MAPLVGTKHLVYFFFFVSLRPLLSFYIHRAAGHKVVKHRIVFGVLYERLLELI